MEFPPGDSHYAIVALLELAGATSWKMVENKNYNHFTYKARGISKEKLKLIHAVLYADKLFDCYVVIKRSSKPIN